MHRRPPISTRTYTRFPYTSLFRSPNQFVMVCSPLLAGNRELSNLLTQCCGFKADWHVNQPAVPTGHGRALKCIWRKKTKRSEEHTYELQSLMRTSYAVFGLRKTKQQHRSKYNNNNKTTYTEK